MSDKVRFGIVGCGTISRFHAYAIGMTPGAELVGACDSDAASAAAFAREQGIHAYSTLEELLDSGGVDAVSICTPSGLHAGQALTAIARGKHVLLEKPICLTLRDADGIIRAADEAGVRAGVISQMRFAPTVQALRGAVGDGAFGKIVSASLSMKYYRTLEYYRSSAWRGTFAFDGGGALMNQGIHGVDVLQYVAGPVDSVLAVTRTQTRPIEVEDSVAAVLEFSSGAIGTLEASTTSFPGYPRRLEICGDEGSVVMEEADILRWDLKAKAPDKLRDENTRASSSDPKAIGKDSHVRQMQNFVRSILYGEELLVSAEQGRIPLAIILAVYESAKSGQRVRVSGGPGA